jgi:hypothetical protein
VVDVESQTVRMIENGANPFDTILVTLNRLPTLANAEKSALLGK